MSRGSIWPGASSLKVLRQTSTRKRAASTTKTRKSSSALTVVGRQKRFSRSRWGMQSRHLRASNDYAKSDGDSMPARRVAGGMSQVVSQVCRKFRQFQPLRGIPADWCCSNGWQTLVDQNREEVLEWRMTNGASTAGGESYTWRSAHPIPHHGYRIGVRHDEGGWLVRRACVWNGRLRSLGFARDDSKRARDDTSVLVGRHV